MNGVHTRWCHDCGTKWWEDWDADFDGPILDCLRDFWCQVAIGAALASLRDLVEIADPGSPEEDERWSRACAVLGYAGAPLSTA